MWANWTQGQQKGTYIHVSQVARHTTDIGMQEFIQNNHVYFFTKENVVCEILYDLGDDHETPSDDASIIFWYLHINDLRRNNGGRYEA